MMVMRHNGWERRCPYCLSRKLKVIDYNLAATQFHEKFGKYWFQLKCEKCGGVCEDISNLESGRELREQAEAKRKMREAQINEEVQT
jgi:hypothetical protein